MVAVAVLSICCLWVQFSDMYYLQRAQWTSALSGYGAIVLLGISLAASPGLKLARWLRVPCSRSVALGVRKHFGVGSALLAMLHAALMLTTYLQCEWRLVWQWPYVRSGALALLILALLTLTSSGRVVALLRWKLWKPLHRLVYVLPILLMHHLLMSPFAERWVALLLACSAVVLLLLRWLPEPAIVRKQASAEALSANVDSVSQANAISTSQTNTGSTSHE